MRILFSMSVLQCNWDKERRNCPAPRCKAIYASILDAGRRIDGGSDARADDLLAQPFGHVDPGFRIAIFADVAMALVLTGGAVVLRCLYDSGALLFFAVIFICSDAVGGNRECARGDKGGE